jgi:hypothetical protein
MTKQEKPMSDLTICILKGTEIGRVGLAVHDTEGWQTFTPVLMNMQNALVVTVSSFHCHDNGSVINMRSYGRIPHVKFIRNRNIIGAFKICPSGRIREYIAHALRGIRMRAT